MKCFKRLILLFILAISALYSSHPAFSATTAYIKWKYGKYLNPFL